MPEHEVLAGNADSGISSVMQHSEGKLSGEIGSGLHTDSSLEDTDSLLSLSDGEAGGVLQEDSLDFVAEGQKIYSDYAENALAVNSLAMRQAVGLSQEKSFVSVADGQILS